PVGLLEGDKPSGLAHLEQLLSSPPGVSGLDPQTAAAEPKVNELDLLERELLREVTLVDHARRLARLATLQQRVRQEADVGGPGDQHAVGDGEIDRLPQIRDRCSKIAAVCLLLAARHQHQRDVEDVPAPASLSNRLVED